MHLHSFIFNSHTRVHGALCWPACSTASADFCCHNWFLICHSYCILIIFYYFNNFISTSFPFSHVCLGVSCSVNSFPQGFIRVISDADSDSSATVFVKCHGYYSRVVCCSSFHSQLSQGKAVGELFLCRACADRLPSLFACLSLQQHGQERRLTT